jgi:hypothetical protein
VKAGADSSNGAATLGALGVDGEGLREALVDCPGGDYPCRGMRRVLLLSAVGLLGFGSPTSAAGGRKDNKPLRFHTMAEVLSSLGTPHAIEQARSFDEYGNPQPGIELVYCRAGENRFLVSSAGSVQRARVERCTRRTDTVRSKRQGETIVDLYARLGNPDWVVANPTAPDPAVQLTFKALRKAYHISRHGNTVAEISLPELPDYPGGTTIAEVCRDLGRPDLIASAEEFQAKSEEGAKQPSVVMVYALFDHRRWYIAADGTVLFVHKKLSYPTWYSKRAERSDETMAELMNRLGKPDLIAPVDRHSAIIARAPLATIELSYQRLNKRWYASRNGYVVHCEPAPCEVVPE